ncbi:MAG: type II toxin-antitoxin system VapC family toxin [Candidatus Sulfotelmatobacter sp.]
MKRFVLDASVALAWLLDRPTAPYADRVRHLLLGGCRAVVPALWQLEIANGFIVAERRGLLTSSETDEALQNLDVIIAEAVESSRDILSMRSVIRTAREFRLTAYDAVYLETAVRQELPLATLDRQLLLAASRAGVEIIS